jgi:multiple sugar transport system permease protein
MRRSGRQTWITTTIALVILAVFLFPVYWMVNASLQSGVTAAHTTWFPFHLSFSSYRLAFASEKKDVLTSIIVASGATVVEILIATPAAYALSRFRLPSTRLLIMGILVTQMIPGIVIANALYRTYSSVHLLNSYLGLMLADASLGIPFSILLVRSFMAGIPTEIIEAARVDGAGRLRTLVTIVVPVSKNGIVTAALFSFLFAWSDLLFALTLTTSTKIQPITLGIYQFVGVDRQIWGPVMATAVIASLPAVVLLLVAQRFIASGVTVGSVK